MTKQSYWFTNWTRGLDVCTVQICSLLHRFCVALPERERHLAGTCSSAERVRRAGRGSVEHVRRLRAVAPIRIRRSSARLSHLFASRIKKGDPGRLSRALSSIHRLCSSAKDQSGIEMAAHCFRRLRSAEGRNAIRALQGKQHRIRARQVRRRQRRTFNAAHHLQLEARKERVVGQFE